MGIFSRRKAPAVPAATQDPEAEPSSPHALSFQYASQKPAPQQWPHAPTVQYTPVTQQSPPSFPGAAESADLVEEAFQQRVPPIPLSSRRDEYSKPGTSQRGRSASPPHTPSYLPESYRSEYSGGTSGDMVSRDGSMRSDGVHVRMGRDGHVSIRAEKGKRVSLRNDSFESDDACCYRSSSVCRTCRKKDHCDCYTREQHCHHRRHNRCRPRVEVHEQTFACYDPDCRGGESCHQWTMHKDHVAAGSGAHHQPHSTTTTTTTYHTTPASQVFVTGVQPVVQPVVTGVQPVISGVQPVVSSVQVGSVQPLPLQTAVSHQSYVIAGTTPVMQTTTPYLVSNRPYPVTYGSVPVVVPQAGGFQTQYIGPIGGSGPQIRKLC